MTPGEARAIIDGGTHPLVKVWRSGGEWEGRAVGYIPGPSLLIEKENGCRVALAIDGLVLLSSEDDDA